MAQEQLKITQQEILINFIRDLQNHVDSADVLQKVLYGHIHVEYALNALIESGIPFPSKLNLKKQTFLSKVRFALSVGLIHPDIGPLLEKLGKLRNLFAHNIDVNFNKKDERDFINVAKQSQLKGQIKASGKNWNSDFACVIWCLWIYLFEQLVKAVATRKDITILRKRIVNIDPEESLSNVPKSIFISANKILKANLNSK